MLRLGLRRHTVEPLDFTAAAGWYKKAMDAGDLWSATNLAQLYMEGQGVEVDYEEAERLLLLALTQSEQQENPSVDSLAGSLERLASLVVVSGRFQKAERLLRNSLLLRQDQVPRTAP